MGELKMPFTIPDKLQMPPTFEQIVNALPENKRDEFMALNRIYNRFNSEDYDRGDESLEPMPEIPSPAEEEAIKRFEELRETALNTLKK